MSTATTPRPQAPASALSRRSLRWIAWFRGHARRYMARRFHAARLARAGFQPGPDTLAGPVVVVMNHPSWWDPMFGVVLSDLFPGRVHTVPMDATALAKYPFFERLGFFGIEPGTARGSREFLRKGTAALANPGGMLWVTAQGRFVDVRARPVELKEGIGHLACRARNGWVVPLAIEYGFWDESTPEVFARFGSPLALGVTDQRPAAAWTARIAASLEQAQDLLSADVQNRDPSRFVTLFDGGVGVGGVYDVWRRFRAVVRGERFDAAHASGLPQEDRPTLIRPEAP